MSTPEHKVLFKPSEIKVLVKDNATIKDAIEIAGLNLEFPCGGIGTCGRCRVIVETGKIETNLTPHISSCEAECGFVLACSTRIKGDVVVYLPFPQTEEISISKNDIVLSEKSELLSVSRFNTSVDTPIKLFSIEINPPNLNDNVNDRTRFLSYLTKISGTDNLLMDISLLRDLPNTLRDAHWKPFVIAEDFGFKEESLRLLKIINNQHKPNLFGLAIDVGTTTIEIVLVDLNNGDVIGRAAAFNGQIRFGEDVISRIIYSQREGGLSQLQKLVIDTVNELVSDLCEQNAINPQDIFDVVMAANPTMTHLFFAVSPKYLREEPYVPCFSNPGLVPAHILGLKCNPLARITPIDSIGSYIGGDIVAGVLSSGIHKSQELKLFIDVGTNGEIRGE